MIKDVDGARMKRASVVVFFILVDVVFVSCAYVVAVVFVFRFLMLKGIGCYSPFTFIIFSSQYKIRIKVSVTQGTEMKNRNDPN